MKTRISALHGKLNLLLPRHMRDQHVSSVKNQLLCHSKQIPNATTNTFTYGDGCIPEGYQDRSF